MSVEPGQPAPDFTLHTPEREEWTLSDALKQGPVVLCFVPFAFTGVCTTEMECIHNEMDRWKDKATVVGISCDSFAALGAWRDQLGLTHTLLSDQHRAVCRAFGNFWADMNVAQRATFVIGTDRTIQWAQVREPGNAMAFDEVLSHV